MSEEIDRIIRDAETSLNAGDAERARRLFKQAESTVNFSEKRDDIAATYLRIAYTCHSMNDPGLAREYYEKAGDIYRILLMSKPDNMNYLYIIGNMQNNLGSLHEKEGRAVEANDCYKLAITCYEKLTGSNVYNLEYHVNLGIIQNNLGVLLRNMGRLDESGKVLKQALRTRENLSAGYPDNIKYKSDIAGTRYNLGNLLSDIGRLDEAKACYELALDQCESLLKSDPMDLQYQLYVANIKNNLANILQLMGQLEPARYLFEQSLIIHESLSEKNPDDAILRSNKADSQVSLGNIYHEIGRLDESNSRYKQALEAYQSLSGQYPANRIYRFKVAHTLHNLGMLLNDHGIISSDQELLKSAKALYEQSIEVYGSLRRSDPQNTSYELGVANTLSPLGLVLYNLGNLKEAKIRFGEALGAFKSLLAKDPENAQYQFKLASAINDFSLVFSGEGNYIEALRLLVDAKSRAMRFNCTSLIPVICYYTGKCKEKAGDLSGAYESYLESIAQIETIRSNFVMEEQKLDIMWNKASVYADMIKLCYNLGNMAEACEYVERSKSRTLLDYLRLIELDAPEHVPEAQRSRERELIESIKITDRKARTAVRVEEAHILSRQITGLQSELETLYDQMEQVAPEYVDIRRGTPLKFQGIIDLLKRQEKRTAFIQYYTTPEKVFIFVINSKDCLLKVRAVTLPSAKLSKYFKIFVQDVRFYQTDQPEKGENWLELSKYLIEPVIGDIDGCEMLYLIPHGLLHYLPLHALMIDGQRLIERYPVVYAPSLTMLKYTIKEEPEYARSCLSIGYTDDTYEREDFEGEALQVAKIFGTRPYLGKNATGQLLKWADYDIVHLSCHGNFIPGKPLDSGLYLSDGCLTVKDVFNLSIKASMIVLSACKTGLNEQKPGDELIGLTRAFLYSGISSIMVSLWSVHAHATLEMMRSFYQKIRDGKMSKAEALRQAQIEMIREKQYSHPFYWAPFTLIGDWK